jgi:AAA15 family ATPase/GTPase
MLIQFRVANFKSFKDEAILSMAASSLDKDLHPESIVSTSGRSPLHVLKSAVLYGANASGKSKLVDALHFFRQFVIDSAKESQSGEMIRVDPFRLNTETMEAGSEFEILLEDEGTMFRYGFEATTSRIISEWLYRRKSLKEVELFYRDEDEIEIHPDFKGAKLLAENKFMRSNSLFLSVAAQFNTDIGRQVLQLIQKVRVISGLREDGYHGYTIGKIQQESYKRKVLSLIQSADLGIQDIKPVTVKLDELPAEGSNKMREIIAKHQIDEKADLLTDVSTAHDVRDALGEVRGRVDFSLEKEESSGTKKFVALMGPVLDSLAKGYVLVIDEMDSKLHPNLSEKIVELFHSKATNLNNAQLIFNTHNTNMLTSDLFRRDQIWFVEKNREGASSLFSLAEFKADQVRKGEAFEPNYLRGKYGAVPYLAGFDEIDFTEA